MATFEELLLAKLQQSVYNNFGKDNFDEDRFGKFDEPTPLNNLIIAIKNNLKKITNYQSKFNHVILDKYIQSLTDLYDNLNDTGKDLLIDLIAYRILGSRKVKLPVNSLENAKIYSDFASLKDANDTLNSGFNNAILNKFNLKPKGIDVEIYYNYTGLAIDFGLEQYAYKENGKTIVEASKGEVVLDIGGCWGDTALYFANKVGETGKVYSFEFIPNNIKIHTINTNLNPVYKNVISLVPHPVSEFSDQKIYFKDYGPGSSIAIEDFGGSDGQTTTLSVDDFVARENISKIDMIKMDIEGAEIYALRGAINTIKKFRPKLAIAIYHSIDDFVNIPKWILDLNCGYKLYLGHYTIHKEETVIFAVPN